MPDPHCVVLTRRELYELVWGTPIYKLAPRYGISGVGLAKACKRMLVPVPYRGYWEKLHHGSTARKIPLRKLSDEEEKKHWVRLTLCEPPPGRPLTEAEQLAQSEKAADKRIVVPEKVRKLHPIVALTKANLRPGQKSGANLLRTDGTDSIEVWIAKATVGRAMLILDTIVRALESRAFRVAIEPGRRRMSVNVLGEWQRFSLTEALTKTEVELSEDERRWRSKLPGLYPPGTKKYAFQPSGRLILRIETYSFGMRKSWCDRKSRTVEHILNDFIAGLIRQAGEDLERRRKREEADRREREEKERRAVEAERQRLLEEQIQQLHDDAAAFAEASTLRRYITAVREEAARRHGVGDEVSEVERWAAWAEEQADLLDPLTVGKDLPKAPDL